MPDRLRVAMASYYLPSDSKIGAGYMAHRLAEAMVERGHEVTMYSPCHKPENALYRHVRIPMHGSLRTFRWGLRVGELQLSGHDVFHAHGDNHLRFGRRTPAHVRTLYGSCFSEAIHIRGVTGRLRMLALGITEIGGSLAADETVAISRNTRFFYPWVNRVIPCGVDRKLFCPGIKDAAPTILFVGTYQRRKRGRLLMEVFQREVLPAFPEARLWMVCSDAPSAPGVEVLGRISDDQLADRYRRAWLFCLPSTYEGFGVPYVEAMAAGTPVVATPNPGALEVTENGRFGVISQASTLGASIVGLLNNPGRRAHFAEAGMTRARGFDWEIVAASYERLYLEILDSRRRRP